MFVGMVLSSVSPKIIELKMNKVRWERLQKLRRQLYAPCVIKKTRPCRAFTILFIPGCDSCLCKESWHQPTTAPCQKQLNRDVTHRGRKADTSRQEPRSIIVVSLHSPIPSPSFLD